MIVGIPVVAAIAVAYVRWEYKRRKISRKDKEEHIPLAKAERGQGVGDNNVRPLILRSWIVRGSRQVLLTVYPTVPTGRVR